MRLSVNVDNYTNDDNNCGLIKGSAPWAATVRYGAQYRDRSAWFGMCGPKSSSTVSQSTANLLCSGASSSCGRDVTCMRNYINSMTSSGSATICGNNRYNLAVTDASNQGTAYAYGAYWAYDGSYAACLFYCVR